MEEINRRVARLTCLARYALKKEVAANDPLEATTRREGGTI
jgi:hypothetical protein